MSMLDRLRRRASSSTISSSKPSTSTSTSTAPTPASTSTNESTAARSSFVHRRKAMPYEVPDAQGRCFVLDLPDEILSKVLGRLDRASLARCHRVCKQFSTLLSSADLALHHLLQLHSLRLNPHALSASTSIALIPPSKAQLLSTLRERLTRFRNFKPKSTTPVKFEEREGRLYEYLEGVLLRNISRTSRERGREVAVYELDKMEDWEDLPGPALTSRRPQGEDSQDQDDADADDDMDVVDQEEGEEHADIRRSKRFDFDILDFAVDPGLDLFVLAEQRINTTARHYTMHFHLLTLSTFEPHPRAAQPLLKWPLALAQRETSLGFQICDDGLFVLRNNSRGAAPDHLCGWQWTTGRLAVTIKAPPVTTFESFVLLTPSSFVIPSVATRIRTDSSFQDDLADPRDLEFSLHLQLYAFPPFSAVPYVSGQGPAPPPHTAINIATIDLPTFVVDFDLDLPPPRMTVRTDPPPRHSFPTHPLDAPAPFVCEPESGVIVLEFYCQPFGPTTHRAHFVLFTLKTTLLSYLPAPTSPLLFQAFPRPAPVVPWSVIAPKVRMIGPDEPEPSWVCYVYQYRYVTPLPEMANTTLRLYDFDPLRVRKEVYDRKHDGFVATPSKKPLGRGQLSTTTSPNNDIPAQGQGDGTTFPTDPIWNFLGIRPPLFADHRSDPSTSATNSDAEKSIDGERDGIHLITAETVLPQRAHLAKEVRTGKDFPYLYVEKRWGGEVDSVVIDGQRIVAFDSEGDGEVMEVMDF